MRKRTAIMLMTAVISLLFVMPLFSGDAEAAGDSDTAGGVNFSFSPNSQGTSDVNAGKYVDVYVHIYNGSGGVRFVEFTGDDFSKGHIETPGRPGNSPVELDDGAIYTLHIRIVADRYIGSEIVDIELFFVVYDPAVIPVTEHECSLTKSVYIHSGRASEDQFNRVMGVFANPLPSPFDTAVYSALLTLLIWLAIALLVTHMILPLAVMPFLIKDHEYRRAAAKKVRIPLFILIMLYGVTVCAAVIGAGEYLISVIDTFAAIIYIAVGAWIVLRLYTAALEARDRRKADDRSDSLTPLLLMIGQIAIAMVSVGAVLSALGFDMMIIVTGAGIVGLAISLGAQNTLAQFFSGLTLLVNRPFRQGDLVRIDNGSDTLEVINVGFMMTTFRNWGNSEIFTMPNQKVVSSVIVNITADTPAYRISVLVRVPYGTDVAVAKKCALEAMTEHPRILTDGSQDMPKARLDDLSESSMTIRVSGFVDDFDDNRSIAAEIRERICAKYLEHGVSFSVPTVDVRIKDKDEPGA
jgi:small-conductance mechanosensitive channel